MDLHSVFHWFIVTLLLLFSCKLIIKYVFRNRCHSKASLVGKTVLITGANSGIGKATALNLAERGARVIMACRSLVKGEMVRKEIMDKTGNKNIVLERIDLSDMWSVKKAAEHILERETRLDVLINNAALIGSERKITEDGFELYFASSYIGPFLLTKLLLPLLMRTSASRIVNVSSMAYAYGEIDFDNLMCEKRFRGWDVYCSSKLGNVLFTRELSERLKGSGVTVNCLHPGFILTNIFRSLPGIAYYLTIAVTWWFSISPDDGCQTTVHCAVDETLATVTGHFFENCKVSELKPVGRDDVVARKLWETTESFIEKFLPPNKECSDKSPKMAYKQTNL